MRNDGDKNNDVFDQVKHDGDNIDLKSGKKVNEKQNSIDKGVKRSVHNGGDKDNNPEKKIGNKDFKFKKNNGDKDIEFKNANGDTKNNKNVGEKYNKFNKKDGDKDTKYKKNDGDAENKFKKNIGDKDNNKNKPTSESVDDQHKGRLDEKDISVILCDEAFGKIKEGRRRMIVRITSWSYKSHVDPNSSTIHYDLTKRRIDLLVEATDIPNFIPTLTL